MAHRNARIARRTRLQLSIPGRWYVALALGVGLAAMGSGNNSLYLIEALLLGAIILSGILSERFVHAVELRVHRSHAIATAPSPDRIELRNLRNFPLFCLEICEWRNGRAEPIAYLPRLGPKERVLVRSEQILPRRGIHAWEGLAVATSYPFGLARKLRIFLHAEERVVWPAPPEEPSGAARIELLPSSRGRQQEELNDGQLRPYELGDDPRWIVWTLSAKEPVPWVRARTRQQEVPQVLLDLGQIRPAELETRISEAARQFYEPAPGQTLSQALSSQGSLTLRYPLGASAKASRKIIYGRVPALNQLAVLHLDKEEEC